MQEESFDGSLMNRHGISQVFVGASGVLLKIRVNPLRNVLGYIMCVSAFFPDRFGFLGKGRKWGISLA